MVCRFSQACSAEGRTSQSEHRRRQRRRPLKRGRIVSHSRHRPGRCRIRRRNRKSLWTWREEEGVSPRCRRVYAQSIEEIVERSDNAGCVYRTVASRSRDEGTDRRRAADGGMQTCREWSQSWAGLPRCEMKRGVSRVKQGAASWQCLLLSCEAERNELAVASGREINV